MRIARTLQLALCGATLCAALAFTVRADDYNEKTVVTFSESVQIPGQVLPAGTYTFMLLDSPADRNLVEVWNADQSNLLATLQAIPDIHMPPPDHPMYSPDHATFELDEQPAGHPLLLRSFFFPGSLDGFQFVYHTAQPTR